MCGHARADEAAARFDVLDDGGGKDVLGDTNRAVGRGYVDGGGEGGRRWEVRAEEEDEVAEVGGEAGASKGGCAELGVEGAGGEDLGRGGKVRGNGGRKGRCGARTGRATDSRWPQSRTRPVMRPTVKRDSKWLDAKDTEGTWD